MSNNQDNQTPELNGEVLTDIQNQAAAISEQASEERDLVNQLMGQVQMANSFARFADVVSLTKLAHIKETRMYKALAGKKGVDPDGNEIADVGTFDGFCKALGLSRSKVDEDLSNLKAFGEEALNNLNAIGIGYREMRKYRRLPEDQKEALLEVAKAGDKETFVELAEEIIAKGAKDKDELQKQLDEKTADYEAQSDLMHTTAMDLTETRMDLEKTKRGFQMLKPDEKVTKAREAIEDPMEAIELDLKNLRTGFDKLIDVSEEAGTDQRMWMAKKVSEIEKTLIGLREDLSLPDPDGVDMSWANPEALAAVEAELGVSGGEEMQYDFDKDQYVPHNDDKEPSDETESGQD